MIGEFSLAKFLFGFGQKALVAAIKLCKQKAEKTQAQALEELLRQHEAGKPLYAKIEQRLSVSLQTLRMPAPLLEALRELDCDDLLRDAVGAALAAGELSVPRLAGMLTIRSEVLAAHPEEVSALAAAWLDAVYLAIGDIPALAHALQLQSQHRAEAQLDRSELKLDALCAIVIEKSQQQELRDAHLHAVLQKTLQSEFARLRLPDVEPAIANHGALQSRFQQRFEKCRERLVHGSVLQAEEEHAELIADLTAAGTLADRDLLFRSYLNYSSCLLEQRRFEDAAAALDRAGVLAPEDLRLKRHTAVLLAHRGETEQALALVRELRAAEPGESKHLHNEAALLLELDSLDDLQALLDAHPLDDADYFCHAAHVALRQNRIEAAVAAARRACELNPDSEAPWIALAYALGFPAIERRQRGEPQALAADATELPHLREALTAAERATDILKKRDRTRARAEVLANALAFHAALNEDEAALALGRELWAGGDRSEVTLRNLYYLQMRNGQFEEALTTAEAMMAADLDDGRLRHAQALTALGRFEPVLHEWKAVTEASGSEGPDDDWVRVASRAWCAAQQRERALTLLEQMIEHRPESSDLHLEHAAVLEELGRTEAAATALARAEEVSSASAQVAADYGLFLYRQGRWAEALARMERVGASSTASPLHPRYLICLFNSGAVGACSKLVSAWLESAVGYDDTVYALGARSAMLSEDLPVAREFLDELLRRGSDRDGEHRKMLGHVYLRLDEQEQAYNVLAKVTADQPRDVDALILLGQVCTARGLHQEALEHTRKAAELEPENAQVRAAFFGAMVALPAGFTPTADCIEAHHKNIAALTEHPSKILRAVEVTPDLGEIQKMLRENEKQVRRVVEAADAQLTPFGFLATQTGTALHEAWGACTRDPKRGIRMCLGSSEAQNEQLAVARKGEPVSVDLLVLFTLQGLGMLPVLARQHSKIFAHIGLLDTIVDQLRHLRDHPGSGRIGSHEGRLFLLEGDPAEEGRTIASLTAIRDFLKGPSVQLVGLTPGAIADERLVQLSTACGRACILPIFVALERGAALLSDDLVVRGIGHVAVAVNGFCSQALLRAARDRGALADAEYQDAVLRLLEWNYHFVADEARTLIRLFHRTPDPTQPLAKSLITRVGNPACTTVAALRVLTGCFAYISTHRAMGGVREARDSWIETMWRAVLEARPDGTLVHRFLYFLAIQFLTRPAQFMGAVVWGLRHVPELKPLRVPVLRWALQIANSLAETDADLPASWPVSADDWGKQICALRLLIRLEAV